MKTIAEMSMEDLECELQRLMREEDAIRAMKKSLSDEVRARIGHAKMLRIELKKAQQALAPKAS